MAPPVPCRESFINIVSGLPRSGTSLMMQMLAAGGMTILTDGRRPADDDNPRGYLELEAVKRLGEGSNWLDDARGKAVKVIYRLLYDLPSGRECRVVFMRRRMTEVLVSQRRMLERGTELRQLTAQPVAAPDGELAELFEMELLRLEQWRRARTDLKFLDVDYNELLADPMPSVIAVTEFLGGGLNLTAMRSAISPALYRNRYDATPSLARHSA